MLRAFPKAEDNNATAGGDTDALLRPRGKSVPFTAEGTPPGENADATITGGAQQDDQIENRAMLAGLPETETEDPEHDFLKMVREAEEQASLYIQQVNRRAWAQSLRAFHNEHYLGSRYNKPDWRNRSKIFRPKTRSGVRKDQAAVAASLFGTVDAISCAAGDESSPIQRAAASVMEQLVNYRTDRTSGPAAIPWFPTAMGARQDALITGICMSKQSWKLELKKKKDPERNLEAGKNGVYEEVERDVYVPETDRPDVQLIPPENFVIDPAAEYTNPVQTAQYIIIKWPMRIDEIKRRQDNPISPWNPVSEEMLRTASVESSRFESAAIRQAREMGLDRLEKSQTGTTFQVIWVYEVFIRIGSEDWTFYSIGDKAYLTDPRPVAEVYPEQNGQRPLVMGYGSLESHRIFPMSPVESWQMYQVELNDIANIALDVLKQNSMPVVKVRRGRQIDLDQIKRRSSGSSILVTDKDDVTWEKPPEVPQSLPLLTRALELELDDLAGQFNGQTVQDNNALSRTLGGLKLVAGASNALQEYDIRVWIETWCEPVLAQLVKLEQYYESDPVVLGLCGARAQLFQKHGVNQIDNALLEQEVTVRVSIGLGAGDPAQRLQKFASAVQIALPLLQTSPELQSGTIVIDWEAVMEEVFGAAGYRDGGMRFIKKVPPQPNAMMDLQQQEIQSKIEKNKKTAQASLLTGLAAVAKAALGEKEFQADTVDTMLGHQHAARQQLFDQHNAQQEHARADREQVIGVHDKAATHQRADQELQFGRQDAQQEHARADREQVIGVHDKAATHSRADRDQQFGREDANREHSRADREQTIGMHDKAATHARADRDQQFGREDAQQEHSRANQQEGRADRDQMFGRHDAAQEHGRANRQEDRADQDQLLSAQDQGFQHGTGAAQEGREGRKLKNEEQSATQGRDMEDRQLRASHAQQMAKIAQQGRGENAKGNFDVSPFMDAAEPQPGGGGGMQPPQPPAPPQAPPKQPKQPAGDNIPGTGVPLGAAPPMGGATNERTVMFIRDPDTDRIIGARIIERAPGGHLPGGQSGVPLPPPGLGRLN